MDTSQMYSGYFAPSGFDESSLDFPPPPSPPSPALSTPRTPQEYTTHLPPSPSTRPKKLLPPPPTTTRLSTPPPPPSPPSHHHHQQPPSSAAPTISTFSASASSFNHIHIVQPYLAQGQGATLFQNATFQFFNGMPDASGLLGQDGRPPRPANAWILYRSAKMKDLKPGAGAGPNTPGQPRRTQADISKLIAEMWKNESSEVRQYYEAMSDMKKAEHLAAYPTYRFQPMKKAEKEKVRAEKKAQKERERAANSSTSRARGSRSRKRTLDAGSADASELPSVPETNVVAIPQSLPGAHVLAWDSSAPPSTSTPPAASATRKPARKASTSSVAIPPTPTAAGESAPAPLAGWPHPSDATYAAQYASQPSFDCSTTTQYPSYTFSNTATNGVWSAGEASVPVANATASSSSSLQGWMAPQSDGTTYRPTHGDMLGFDAGALFNNPGQEIAVDLPTGFDFNLELGMFGDISHLLNDGTFGSFDAGDLQQGQDGGVSSVPAVGAGGDQQLSDLLDGYFANPVPAPQPHSMQQPSCEQPTVVSPQEYALPSRTRPTPQRIVTSGYPHSASIHSATPTSAHPSHAQYLPPIHTQHLQHHQTYAGPSAVCMPPTSATPTSSVNPYPTPASSTYQNVSHTAHGGAAGHGYYLGNATEEWAVNGGTYHDLSA